MADHGATLGRSLRGTAESTTQTPQTPLTLALQSHTRRPLDTRGRGAEKETCPGKRRTGRAGTASVPLLRENPSERRAPAPPVSRGRVLRPSPEVVTCLGTPISGGLRLPYASMQMKVGKKGALGTAASTSDGMLWARPELRLSAPCPRRFPTAPPAPTSKKPTPPPILRAAAASRRRGTFPGAPRCGQSSGAQSPRGGSRRQRRTGEGGPRTRAHRPCLAVRLGRLESRQRHPPRAFCSSAGTAGTSHKPSPAAPADENLREKSSICRRPGALLWHFIRKGNPGFFFFL